MVEIRAMPPRRSPPSADRQHHAGGAALPSAAGLFATARGLSLAALTRVSRACHRSYMPLGESMELNGARSRRSYRDTWR